MSRKRNRPQQRQRRTRAAAPAGKEAIARRVALVLLVASVVLVFAYAGLSLDALRWAALVTALGTVAAGVYYFIERGRRTLQLEVAFRQATEQLGKDEGPREVKVAGPEGVRPARLLAEDGRWFLEVDGERIEYQLEEPGAETAWPDFRMADFASQLARRRRLRLRSCVTCMHFGHSRVSRLASEGWVGFCTVSGEDTLIPEKDAVHIWHLCPKWKQRPAQ
ncbi:MAG: hypothetical protein ACOYEW_11055 [Anaerolineae bacterium]